MIEFLHSHILSLIIFFPLLMGSFLLMMPLSQKLSRHVAFVSSVIILLLGLYLFFIFEPISAVQYRESLTIIETYGIHYMVGVDGLNLIILLIIVTAFPSLFFILKAQQKGYWANMLLMQSAFSAVILSEDLVFFYAGWEAMLLPIFLTIGLYGKSNDKAKAAMDMMYYTIFGSMLMLIAILYIGVAHYEQFGFYSFKIVDLENVSLSQTQGTILFFVFMLAFAIKVPLWGLHMWMPNAYTKAPVGVTFALSAIASKVAIYAILRFVLPIFPAQFVQFSHLFVFWGIFSMIYFGIAAFSHKNFKTVLAYASASHLGLIIAGVFAINIQSTVGAIYQVIAHAMTSGTMFLLVGKIGRDLHTKDLNALGGIAKKAPIFAIFFAIAMLSSVGLPGTNGFVGEILILIGLFEEWIAFGLLGTLSIIIGASYMFVVYRKAVLEEPNEVTQNFTDLTPKEIVAFLVPILFIFFMGLYPNPFIKKIEPTVKMQYEKFIAPLKDEK